MKMPVSGNTRLDIDNIASVSPPTSLQRHLAAALQSRAERNILRCLPEPLLRRSPPGTHDLSDFTSNDYLSLTYSAELRKRFLKKLERAETVAGAGGSRLLVNGNAHKKLEERLAKFFDSPSALLFNSGYDANVSFFSSIPQPGDFVVYDEAIHASVHDGIRASRIRPTNPRTNSRPFHHNSATALQNVLSDLYSENSGLQSGGSSIFVALESVYSMDGTLAPLSTFVEMVHDTFPAGNAYVIVDEAHATGLYGPSGKGRVMEAKIKQCRGRGVFVRLITFGKALAGSGAVLLTDTLTRSYLINYARPLIYTTSLSNANVLLADCAFDLLEDGSAEQLAKGLHSLTMHFIVLLCSQLRQRSIPSSIVSLPEYLSLHPLLSSSQDPLNLEKISPPSPIIPLLTPRAHALSAYLRTQSKVLARPITWPTVPKGASRVRICLQAGHTKKEVEGLVHGILTWAESINRPTGNAETCRTGGNVTLMSRTVAAKL